MQYKTYEQLKNQVLREVDMEAEDFIQPEEIKDYFNDAVNECEAHIHKLGLEDDYFLKTTSPGLSLTNGQQTLDFPSDIYATKIRGITYTTPERVYQIHRIKGKDKFREIQNLIQQANTGLNYRYQISNNSASEGYKIQLFPYSYETRSNCIVIDYIRNANEIVDNTSIVDIPEFYSFIKAYVKYKLLDKEGNVKASDAQADYIKERDLMLATLAEMTPDYDEGIQPDISIYGEMS